MEIFRLKFLCTPRLNLWMGPNMNDGDQIKVLKAKHAELETALEKEKYKLQHDPIAVSNIKKRKLQIKDELARIETHA